MKRSGFIVGALLLSGCLSHEVSQYQVDVVARVPSMANRLITLCVDIEYIDSNLIGKGHELAHKKICKTAMSDSKGRLTVDFVGKITDWADSLATSWNANGTANITDIEFYIRSDSSTSKNLLPVRIDSTRLRHLNSYVDGSVALNF